MTVEYDVVVVGAGLAGLQAAEVLQNAGQRVIALEARDRVGGRTVCVPFGRQTIDLGAQWIGPGQPRVLAAVERLGLTKFDQYARGGTYYELGSHRGLVRTFAPGIAARELARFAWASARFDWLARRIPLHEPWRATGAAALDMDTVGAFVDRHAGEGIAHDLLMALMRVSFAAEPHQVSLLQGLFYVHSGSGMAHVMGVRGAAQHWRLREGAGAIAQGLARSLTVHLTEPVRVIGRSERQLAVETERGRYLCRRTIVALPPALTRAIQFDPPLPAARAQLCERVPMGSVIKCFARYERPFWRDAGLSGQAIGDQGPVGVVLDASPDDASEGALIVFVLGEQAQRYSGDPEGRRRDVLAGLARHFGEAAGRPVEYVDQDWSREPWSLGCYSGVFGPGVLSGYGRALREPVGGIHWAGTETATQCEGYMEGALQSGERAAREVLASL
jgi:monoamine oxidase